MSGSRSRSSLSLTPRLLFRLLVFCVAFAPLTELLELDFFRHQLLVFARPIVDARALSAGDLYELILRHTWAALYQEEDITATLSRGYSRAGSSRYP